MNLYRCILPLVFISCNPAENSETNSQIKIESKIKAEKPDWIIPFKPKNIRPDCMGDSMPEFDEIKSRLKDKSGKVYKDTVIERIIKKRDVFKPCRKYVYQATYLDLNERLISENKISMMATGRRWAGQPELQDEVLIQYEYDYKQSDIEIINKYNINKTRPRTVWKQRTSTGIIENIKEVWMHPFRDNQFHFTEVAPFPNIHFPLEIGKSWTGGLYIGYGWGDWSDTRGEFSYTIETIEDIITNYGRIDKCWKIKSTANYPFGKSFFDFWFKEELGFVKMNYKNYKGQKLNIELVEVIEN